MNKLLISAIVLVCNIALCFGSDKCQQLTYKYHDVECRLQIEDKVYKHSDTILIKYVVKNNSNHSIWLLDDKIRQLNSATIFSVDSSVQINLHLGGDFYQEFYIVPKCIEVGKHKKYSSCFKIPVDEVVTGFYQKYQDWKGDSLIQDIDISANIALFEKDVLRINNIDYIARFKKPTGNLKNEKDSFIYETNIKRIELSGFYLTINIQR